MDYVIRTNDFIKITFPPPIVIPPLLAPVPLIGKGFSNVVKMRVCVVGDELPPSLLVPLPYTQPPFVIPGTGLLKVTLLPTNQTAISKDKMGKMLLKGAVFVAEFSVVKPAQLPPPVALPDPVLKKPGTAQFITTNVTVKAG